MSANLEVKSEQLFKPTKGDISIESVWRWYQNIQYELMSLDLSQTEIDHMRDYYEEAGLLSLRKVNFFRAHFAQSFFQAAGFLLAKNPQCHILDLGGGTGTQALYLAIHGAKVTVVDMDDIALSSLRKRVASYSRLVGRELLVEGVLHDTHTFDYQNIAPIDGVYSMFAFNMMQPSTQLMSVIQPHLSEDARLAVIDGNNLSWLSRLVPSRRRAVWTPLEFARELRRDGFQIEQHEGAIVMPPFAWRVLHQKFAERIDRKLRGNWFFPISHQILAQRVSR